VLLFPVKGLLLGRPLKRELRTLKKTAESVAEAA